AHTHNARRGKRRDPHTPVLLCGKCAPRPRVGAKQTLSFAHRMEQKKEFVLLPQPRKSRISFMKRSPKFSSLRKPTPWILRKASFEVGRCRAMARRVLS